VILDTNGNIFGGFTPVEWESRHPSEDYSDLFKADPTLTSFLFTLKNEQNVPAQKFALKAERKNMALHCYETYGPHFWDIAISDKCNENTTSYTSALERVTPMAPD
jgi:hypothetical protein